MDTARQLKGIFVVHPEDEGQEDIGRNAKHILARSASPEMKRSNPLQQTLRFRTTDASFQEGNRYSRTKTTSPTKDIIHHVIADWFTAESDEHSSRKSCSRQRLGQVEASARLGRKKKFEASSMDICHLKNSDLEQKFQKCKGRVVLRGDIVKDDSGSYAVFTVQGSSASEMTAAKVMDIISRLPGCDGQAADAISAYTQVKMEDAPKVLKVPKSECPDIFGFVYHDTNGQNHGPVWKTQSFLLSEICTVILWQDYYGKGNSTEFYWNTFGKRLHIGSAYL